MFFLWHVFGIKSKNSSSRVLVPEPEDVFLFFFTKVFTICGLYIHFELIFKWDDKGLFFLLFPVLFQLVNLSAEACLYLKKKKKKTQPKRKKKEKKQLAGYLIIIVL